MKSSPQRHTPLRSRSKLARRKGLSRVSGKRKVEGKTYSELRKEYLADHFFCEVRGCYREATEIQHKALRGRFYLRTDTWLAVCHQCGTRCTDEPEWAYRNGYRLTPEQRRKLS